VSKKTSNLLTLLLLAVAVSACATPGGISDEDLLLQAGATRLNGDQVKAHVTGKTEEWIHGGAYYLADGQLKVKWRKTYLTGSWEVSPDGNLCYQLPRWERRCHIYLLEVDEILMLEEGRNNGARAMYDGDNLVALGRYSTGLSRKR
jgi:hypothetical protein